jgi:hypothetical protein
MRNGGQPSLDDRQGARIGEPPDAEEMREAVADEVRHAVNDRAEHEPPGGGCHVLL